MIKEAYLAGVQAAQQSAGLRPYDAQLIAKKTAKREDLIQQKLARIVPHDDQPDTTRAQPFYLSTWSET